MWRLHNAAESRIQKQNRPTMITILPRKTRPQMRLRLTHVIKLLEPSPLNPCQVFILFHNSKTNIIHNGSLWIMVWKSVTFEECSVALFGFCGSSFNLQWPFDFPHNFLSKDEAFTAFLSSSGYKNKSSESRKKGFWDLRWGTLADLARTLFESCSFFCCWARYVTFFPLLAQNPPYQWTPYGQCYGC